MLSTRTPFAKSNDMLPTATRKPLQLKNSNVLDSTVAKIKSVFNKNGYSKLAALPRDFAIKNIQKASEEICEKDWKKENIDPMMMEGLDFSLGEELIEMRRKVERLKFDKEETEKRLKERNNVFEVWRMNVEMRSEEQRKLEAEMDRVCKISKMRALTRFSTVRSMREKEDKRFQVDPIFKWDDDGLEESVGENSNGSPEGKAPETPDILQKV